MGDRPELEGRECGIGRGGCISAQALSSLSGSSVAPSMATTSCSASRGGFKTAVSAFKTAVSAFKTTVSGTISASAPSLSGLGSMLLPVFSPSLHISASSSLSSVLTILLLHSSGAE